MSTTTHLGTIELRRRDDGKVEIGQADPVIGVSLGLIAEQADPRFLFVRDGRIVFAGTDADGQPREATYQVVGFQAAGLAGAEGGLVVCERVQ